MRIKKQVTEPKVLRSRNMQLYELALEWAFGQPYDRLAAEAERREDCNTVELLHLGRRIYLDSVRLARGEISSISIPNRLPRIGEFTDSEAAG